MTRGYDFKHGIYLDIFDGVVISENSTLWSLESQEMVQVLLEARRALDYLGELEFLDHALIDSQETIYRVDESRDTEERLLAIDTNPLATDEQKEYAEYLLGKVGIYRQRIALTRAPRGTLRKQILARDCGRCRYCGCQVNLIEMQIDHIVPYSLGGRTELNNLVVACKKCNLAKSGKTLEESGMVLIPLDTVPT